MRTLPLSSASNLYVGCAMRTLLLSSASNLFFRPRLTHYRLPITQFLIVDYRFDCLVIDNPARSSANKLIE
jgi:hypothetical protein